jgi:hypothetical protein
MHPLQPACSLAGAHWGAHLHEGTGPGGGTCLAVEARPLPPPCCLPAALLAETQAASRLRTPLPLVRLGHDGRWHPTGSAGLVLVSRWPCPSWPFRRGCSPQPLAPLPWLQQTNHSTEANAQRSRTTT